MASRWVTHNEPRRVRPPRAGLRNPFPSLNVASISPIVLMKNVVLTILEDMMIYDDGGDDDRDEAV